MRWHLLHECNPVRWASTLADGKRLIWLDSAQTGHEAARYSYLCIDPVSTALCTHQTLHIDGLPGNKPVIAGLRNWINSYTPARLENGPPFQGGAAGYIAYDFAPVLVDGYRSRHGAPDTPTLEFGLFDTLLAFDHERNETWIMSSGLTREDRQGNTELAAERINALLQLGQSQTRLKCAPTPNWEATVTEAEYIHAVNRTKSYITEGDIYQANISQKFSATGTMEDPFDLYLEMRRSNPAPFSGYAVFPDRIIASTSPERLVGLSAYGKAFAQPIKGTVRRSDNAEEDSRLQASLISSEKDRAENVMIVDLLRNDLSRVCLPHTVEVPSLCKLETFAGLHHLTSTVEGQLRPECDALDLLSAVFPGGSITGAPKLRAMEIIDELETSPRNAFTGSLGYIGFDGAADFNILIRTMEIQSDHAELWAGAGITLLSDPHAEYKETLLKLARLTRQSDTEDVQK